MKTLAALFLPWVWRLAWRDSRSSRRRFLLYSLSISLGIAALVSIGSLGASIRLGIDQQSRALLGADLAIGARNALREPDRALIREIGGDQSEEVSFASMVRFPTRDATRLVNVRALAGPFPYYGSLETDPPSAAQDFRQGDGLLIEESVAQQFQVRLGDPARLGDWDTKVVGFLRRVPGDSIAFASLAPRVYMAATRLPETGLLGKGSIARYRILVRLAEDSPVRTRIEEWRHRLREARLELDTAEKRKEDLGKAAENLNGYLSLVAFVALLLGAVGIASAIHVHVRQRLPQVAVLRCLGAPMGATFAIYLAQALALGTLGVFVGTLGGILIHRLVPAVLAPVLPFPIQVQLSYSATASAALAGLGVSLVFALLPLLAVRRISPLAAIRSAFDPAPRRFDPARWLVLGLIVAAVVGFALSQTRNWRHGLGFAGGLAVAFLVLTGAARGLVWIARRSQPRFLPFAWRQGLASLHRPNNRTGTLLVSLGLGTFLLLSLQLTREAITRSLLAPNLSTRPNTILFDIQPDQLPEVTAALEELKLPVLEGASIITMRLRTVRGVPVAALATNNAGRTPGWVLQREYRSTWRTNLTGAETLLRGEFIPAIPADQSPVPVSLESGIARDLGVDLGDPLEFDVQGVPVACVVRSIREVDWRQVRPNFFVVFPAGALDAAPAMHVLASRVSGPAESARMQQQVVQRFPNISIIDLTLVLQTLEGVVSKLAFAIRFMALFTVGTGLLVLAGVVVTGRWQRLQEAILLRTLGAGRATIRNILVAEYAGLGLIAASSGTLLALAAGWALTHFLFGLPFRPSPVEPLAALVAVPALTVIVGLLSSRGVSDHPPLEILRNES